MGFGVYSTPIQPLKIDLKKGLAWSPLVLVIFLIFKSKRMFKKAARGRFLSPYLSNAGSGGSAGYINF
jgi:hypothetical protein